MTNSMLLIKRIACAAGIALLMTGSARASVVYSTDFTNDAYTQVNGDIVFDDGLTLPTSEWFGSNNGIGIDGVDLTLANPTQNRYRGSGVWLDTTGWTVGPVAVEVDVANFVSGADTTLFFQAYTANGVDVTATNTVSLDLHGAAGIAGVPTANGSATISTLGAAQTITANGTDVLFTFNFNGTDDFVGLTFVQENVSGGTDFGSADLDNLTVTTNMAVPEPSSLALLTAGFGLIGLRRRRLK